MAGHAYKSRFARKKLKQIVKEQNGKIRDLQSRLFGKKSEKKGSSKKDGKKDRLPT